MQRRSVVLPAPFGPTIPTTSPRLASRFTPSSTCRLPNRFDTSRNSRTGPSSLAVVPAPFAVGRARSEAAGAAERARTRLRVSASDRTSRVMPLASAGTTPCGR